MSVVLNECTSIRAICNTSDFPLQFGPLEEREELVGRIFGPDGLEARLARES